LISKDDKNPDNLIFDQIMMGYYTEMKDSKNADKTMQELKDMVFKEFSKKIQSFIQKMVNLELKI
jgi:SMC interacting uncharacterized protein involved in chromosome segregation